MVHVLIRHKVADYARWKEAFDAHLSTRKANGELSHHLYLALDDPRDVTIAMDWDGLDAARAFLASAELKQAMQQAGVVGEPEIRILQDAAVVRRSAAD